MNTTTATHLGFNKPYKFLKSYSIADQRLFFGRREDANELLSKILFYKFIIFYAQSGAGKTSLIQASVIPKLESKHYQPVIIRFGDNPSYDTQQQIISYLYPSLSLEARAIEKIASTLYGEDSLWKGVSIHDLLENYNSLKITDSMKRILLAFFENNGIIDNKSDRRKSQPHFYKLLRGSIKIDGYSNILRSRGTKSNKIFKIKEETKLEKLIEYLSNSAAEEEVNNYFDLTSPTKTLDGFCSALFKSYNYKKYPLPLVLIFDQFEELFTRFSGIDKCQVRDNFIDKIKALHERKEWPIKIVICIRREYLANMDSFKSLDMDFESSLFSIDLLTAEQAQDAVRRPANIYGYDYDDECLTMIMDELKKQEEDRYIYPPHLQIVCEKLWEEEGQKFFNSKSSNLTSIITKDVYEKLEGLKGIFKNYLSSIISTFSPYKNRQVMNILSKLITPDHTRNIFNENAMLNILGKNIDKNKELLHQLKQHRLIRTIKIYGRDFLEITHDSLIPIIEDAVVKSLGTINKYGYLAIGASLIYLGIGIYFLLKSNAVFGFLFSGIALYFIFFALMVLYKKTPYYGPDPLEKITSFFEKQFKKLSKKTSTIEE